MDEGFISTVYIYSQFPFAWYSFSGKYSLMIRNRYVMHFRGISLTKAITVSKRSFRSAMFHIELELEPYILKIVLCHLNPEAPRVMTVQKKKKKHNRQKVKTRSLQDKEQVFAWLNDEMKVSHGSVSSQQRENRLSRCSAKLRGPSTEFLLTPTHT